MGELTDVSKQDTIIVLKSSFLEGVVVLIVVVQRLAKKVQAV